MMARSWNPAFLPARYPNMLVNGAGGIAVGMATNIPPHNITEVINATLALIDNPDLDSLALMQYIPAPDFPTGGLILGQAGATKAYTEGRGSVPHPCQNAYRGNPQRPHGDYH